MDKKIYLDHAATTALDKSVFEAMLPYFQDNFGNPSSVHSFGQEAMDAVNTSREKVAKFLNCDPEEIIFTSGATESNNLAIQGVVKKYWQEKGSDAPTPHIITSAIEHHCVLDTVKELQKSNLIEATILPVDTEGIVNLENLKENIKENTILVSIMYVNNEIGTVQPIEEIGEIIKSQNSNRKSKILFHTDAVQAINYFDCDTKKLGVDILSFSGHKIYGPKGSGVLFIKKGTPIGPIQFGGGQEYKFRPGTHNVPAIVGIGKAVEMVSDTKMQDLRLKIKDLRDYLIDKMLKEIPNSYLNGSKEKRSPNNANFRFDDIEGEGLLLSLDMEGIAASTGSACSSGSLDPSHVLLALGLKHEQAHGSLRITLGKHTTKKEIDFLIEKTKETISRLRKISGDVLKEFDKNK